MMVAGASRFFLLLHAAFLCAFAGSVPADEAPQRPPFITTPDEVVERMLLLAGTTAQDTVFDLGSGDGRIVIAAARKFGARAHGIEIEPRLVALARENAARAGLGERASFEQADVLRADIRRASVVTLYLLPFLIDKLQPRLLDELRPGTRIVSHAFGMVGWRPDRSEELRISKRHAGQGDESRIFLWVVPAQARGRWAGSGWRLQIGQNFQQLDIEGEVAGRPFLAEQARLEGSAISFSGGRYRFSGIVDGGRISGRLEHEGRAETLELLRQ